MHPKYKRKAAKAKAAKLKANGSAGSGMLGGEKDLSMRKFPGLSMPDQEWRPAEDYLDERSSKEFNTSEKLPESISIDNTMNEHAAVASRRNRPSADDYLAAGPPAKRHRGTMPDVDRGYEGMGERRGDSRDNGYLHDDRGARGRPPASVIDDRPVLYKIYPALVTNVRDFGAFASLEGVRGRIEGTGARLWQVLINVQDLSMFRTSQGSVSLLRRMWSSAMRRSE